MSGRGLAGKSAPEAVSALLKEHGSKIFGLGMRMCGSPEDAEDLVQETFLQAFRKWDQFEGRSAPTSWLYTIAARLCRRRQRPRSGEPRRLEPLDELMARGAAEAEGLVSASEESLDAELQRELEERLEEAVAELPPSFRLPLVLKEFAELSLGEVATVLGVKEATVKTRLHRARLRLQQRLTGEIDSSADDRKAAHARGVCMSLLEAKQEALDRGVEFPVRQEELCWRCRTLFSMLDLTTEACHQLGAVPMPKDLRRRLQARLAAAGS